MNTADTYLEIAESASGIYKEKGSKFLAYIRLILDPEMGKKCISGLKKEHPKARHHCFAWILGWDRQTIRAYDDGEPSGTAGLPILNVLKSTNATNCICVVVRYYGGKKLGAAGLANAYKQAALDAANQLKFVAKIRTRLFMITFDYLLMNKVMNAIKLLSIKVISQTFDLHPIITVSIAFSRTETILQHLQTEVLGIYPAELRRDMCYEHLKIEEKV